ncbi:MAG: redox-sensing transcriptional repressor Rex [Firmicutes bacterium]|nr:redox-sensing transcriptional repressor Rex [Bacillota bacterium]
MPIPKGVVARLPIYFRHLTELQKLGTERLSSAQLGEDLDLTAAQIRSDLSYFGSFGQQGYGYNVSELLKQVQNIIGLDRTYSMVLVGAGNLGKAIGGYEAFREKGFQIKAIFDVDPLLIGNYHTGVIIKPFSELPDYLQKNKTDIGIIATPKEASQEVCQVLAAGGVSSIWNFSPAQLTVPDGVLIEHIHLTDSLLRLVFRINEQRKQFV